ncbi:MAG: SIS domain-containing protein [Alphaproteobacteria bacterium]|nr:SIS domain-containing protein [Alphaproteobacteria bacterium]
MQTEIKEIPSAISRLLAASGDQIDRAAHALGAKNPALIATIARGSSDHAAGFLKYAFELTAAIPVVSLAPSVASIYGARLDLAGAASISISQSGQSPDLLATSHMAAEGGALTLALTNHVSSPLAHMASHAIDIAAGPELSVAATKSFVCSIVAGLLVLARWQKDNELAAALARLPEAAEKAIACDWSALTGPLDADHSLYVLGRGPALAIAGEAALKFKETCGLHAEAYSAAEVMHGPVALVQKRFLVLTLAARDKAEASAVAISEELAGEGAAVFLTSDGARKSQQLAYVATGHPLTDALCPIISFYAFVEAYARHRGLNPDRPPRLNKVTETK